MSLVRSNAEHRLGYISVDNRICVALSRAQNGLYVIGNFRLLAMENTTWKIIVNKMKQLQLFGSGYYNQLMLFIFFFLDFQKFSYVNFRSSD